VSRLICGSINQASKNTAFGGQGAGPPSQKSHAPAPPECVFPVNHKLVMLPPPVFVVFSKIGAMLPPKNNILEACKRVCHSHTRVASLRAELRRPEGASKAQKSAAFFVTRIFVLQRRVFGPENKFAEGKCAEFEIVLVCFLIS